MIDRVTRLEEKEVWGYKNVTVNEPFFQGHFPQYPVMPGVLIIEAMAQLSGIIIVGNREEVEKRNMFFMGVDKVRFRRGVRPGDKLEMHAKMTFHRNSTSTEQAKMEVEAMVEGEVVATATLLVGLFPNNETN